MIYSILAKRKRKINLRKSEEYRLFLDNFNRYSSILSFYHFSINETNPFKIIQANIIIKAMSNKDLIESKLEEIINDLDVDQTFNEEEIRNKIWKLLDEHNAPYISSGKSRVYIPIFSKSLNLIYNEECTKILEYPYNDLITKPKTSCIDLFDVYNLALYDSPFSSLILIKNDKTSSAFYHPDFETIYIINDQGRLDLEIPLFDRYIKHPEQHRVIKKIEEVVDKFYANDFNGFVKSLYENQFISKKTYSYIRHKIFIEMIRRDRIYSKGKNSNEVL